MAEDINFFTKARKFSEVVKNPFNISIFLSIAKNSHITYKELLGNFKQKIQDVSLSIGILEEHNLIEKNPNPLSQKYKLSFNGQIFGEQLKREFPKVKEFLGDENLIEPLKLT